MIFFKKLIHSLYEYYSKGATRDVPYEKSIFVLLGIFLLNLFCVWVLVTPYTPNYSIANDDDKLVRIIGLFIIIIVYYIIMKTWVPEKEIKKMEHNINKKTFVRTFFIYTVFSFLFFVFSVLFKSGKL